MSMLCSFNVALISHMLLCNLPFAKFLFLIQLLPIFMGMEKLHKPALTKLTSTLSLCPPQPQATTTTQNIALF
jgi:hypothetical protein